MKIHLELTSTKSAQDNILLKQLPNWNSNQLNEKLESLKSKDIISLSNKNSSERKISLIVYPNKVLQETPLSINEEEKELLLISNKYIPKQD